TLEKRIDQDVEDTYAEWGHKLKGPKVEDPTIQSLLSRLKSMKQMKQEVAGEGSSATHNKYHEFEDILATDTEATQDSYRSDADEERNGETNDSDDSNMDLLKDEPRGDDDAAIWSVCVQQVYKTTQIYIP
ncbi:hypothetical protein Tco_0075174, partial [Tanacetum coccineum]